VQLHKVITITTLLVILALTALVWFFPSNDDFRLENKFWNGASETLSGPFRPVKSLAQLPAGSTLLLIPYVDFTAAELQTVKDFVVQGGTLILADDYGYGNRVLEFLGFKARFSGRPLLDPLVNYKNQWFPRVVHLSDSPLTEGIENLALNHATAIANVAADEVIAQSSAFSYLDLNANEKQEANEPNGPHPVISRHSLGGGQVILIADPSLFINSMSGIEDNHQLIQNIATLNTTPPLVDQSHLTPSNLHQTKDLLASARGSLASPLGTLGVVALALSLTLLPFWRERRQP
jgi:hypothetical protein